MQSNRVRCLSVSSGMQLDCELKRQPDSQHAFVVYCLAEAACWTDPEPETQPQFGESGS